MDGNITGHFAGDVVGVCCGGGAGEGVSVAVVIAVEAHGGGVAVARDWGDDVTGFLMVGHLLVVIASVVEKGVWAGCFRGIVAAAGGGGGV
jgi:hypothetical protein